MGESAVVLMGYQDSFRTSVHSTTEQMLELIGIPTRLEQVFIVATPAPGTEGETHVVPRSGPAAEMALDGLTQLAAELYEQHPLRHVVHSHPYVHEQRQHDLRRDCMAAAVEELVNRADMVAGTPVAARAVHRNNHEFVICLVLPSRVFEAAPTLEPHQWGTTTASISLLDAALRELKQAVAYDLARPDPGPQDVSLSADELRNRAADRFFREALWRAGTYLDVHRSTIDRIAARTYEKATAAGHILFSRADQAAVTVTTPFAGTVPARQTRQVRKLLETTGPDRALLVTHGSVRGLGSCDLDAVMDPDDDVLEVVVAGHARWELRRHGSALMVVDHGAARIPRPAFDETRLRDMGPRLLGDNAEVERLVDLVEVAASLGHGSTLVVTRNAVAEAERLGAQAVQVHPHDLTRDHFVDLAHIDGAFLLDENLVLHAFGVILDGTADEATGDPARGSRYNSALRYVTARQGDGVLAVVTSDDGGVDLTPDLPPRVPRQLVEDTVIRLEQAAPDPSRQRTFADAEEDLRKLAFYLDEQQAQRANDALDRERQTRHEEGVLEVVREPFEVSPPPDDDSFED